MRRIKYFQVVSCSVVDLEARAVWGPSKHCRDPPSTADAVCRRRLCFFSVLCHRTQALGLSSLLCSAGEEHARRAQGRGRGQDTARGHDQQTPGAPALGGPGQTSTHRSHQTPGGQSGGGQGVTQWTFDIPRRPRQHKPRPLAECPSSSPPIPPKTRVGRWRGFLQGDITSYSTRTVGTGHYFTTHKEIYKYI